MTEIGWSVSEWWEKSKPSEITPLPWLHSATIAYLESLLKPEMSVLEHGSGGSTLWFAQHVKSVISYEHDPDWQMVVKKQAPPNVKVLSGGPPESAQADLLLIDGKQAQREWWLDAALNLVKPGGYIVLDNANRPEYAPARGRLLASPDIYLLAYLNANLPHSLYFVTEFYKRCP